MRPLVCLTLLATMLTNPALGQERRPPEQDEVVLELKEESWVRTKDAKVSVMINAALDSAELASARGHFEKTLKELAPGTAWRITRFQRQRDAAGLERWRVSAEARLSDTELAGLYDRARAASRPGQQVNLEGRNIRPFSSGGLRSERLDRYRP